MGKTGTLSRQLTGWFLVVGLLPWLVVALISYFQSRESLHQAAEQSLGQSADEKIRFINNWFDYRWMDLRLQASSAKNQALLNTLSEALRRSGLPVELFIESSQWQTINKAARSDLRDIRNHYDYIYDLFLIDLNGNILFSEAQQSDLGSNLFTGPLQQSRFAGAVSQSLAQDRAIFSDIERYPPSNNLLCGFLVAPLRDDNGEIQGAFAMQIRLDRLYALLAHEEQDQVYHYLVGTDGLLRSPLAGHEPDVLQKRIATPTFTQWQQIATSSTTQQYVNPLQKGVLGQHNSLTIGNIQWVLISEIDQAAAYSASNWLARFNLMLLVISTVIITTASLYVSKRLTRPITRLSATMEAFARNEPTEPVQVKGKHEIKILADSVNRMMASRERYEGKLRISETATRAALIELSEQQSALSHHAIIAITDVEGTILYVNKKFEEVSGYPSAELVGNNHRILNSGYHPKSFFRNMYKTISSGAVWHAEICNRAKNGQLYWVATTIAPIKNHTGKIERYIAMRTDITQQKAVQQELREARDAAEGAARAKSEFLATMSHEIRTPMNGVLGMLGLLLRTKLNADQQYQARLAMNSAESLLVIINDILDFSKIEAGRLDIEYIDFDLSAMLGDFVETVAHKAHEKGLQLILDTVGIEHSMVRGDPGRIRQILSNLVSNAIKFTAEGEIVICAMLNTTDDYRYQFECSVSDTGMGIPKDRTQHIFDSFTQVDASTTRRFGGTGLGLAIVKQLCQLMQGDIQVSSEDGKGSCFRFYLPLQPSRLSRATVPSANIENVPLLVVDENGTNREVLRRQLELWGARVDLADNAARALHMMNAKLENPDAPHYAVVFMDRLLPDMGGNQLGQAIRENPNFASTKMIMMTAIGNRGDAAKFAAIGFDGYFTKPMTLSDLQDALAVLLEDGDALAKASPLVTHHYLKSLAGNTSPMPGHWPEPCRLLVVEDNSINQTVVQGMLEEIGLHCDMADHGKKALALIRNSDPKYPYNLVLMDCQMPVLDGYSTSRAIRQGLAGDKHQTIPIIAMTANAMAGDREKCLEAGMNDYLSKPINIDELFEKLSLWLTDRVPQPLPDLTGDDGVPWDQADALKRVRNKPERLQTLITMFMTSSTTLLDELRQALVDGDIAAGIHAVHTLKGVAANLSALHLTGAAEKLEAALRAGATENLMPLMEDILQQHQTIEELFTEYLHHHPEQRYGSP